MPSDRVSASVSRLKSHGLRRVALCRSRSRCWRDRAIALSMRPWGLGQFESALHERHRLIVAALSGRASCRDQQDQVDHNVDKVEPGCSPVDRTLSSTSRKGLGPFLGAGGRRHSNAAPGRDDTPPRRRCRRVLPMPARAARSPAGCGDPPAEPRRAGRSSPRSPSRSPSSSRISTGAPSVRAAVVEVAGLNGIHARAFVQFGDVAGFGA